MQVWRVQPAVRRVPVRLKAPSYGKIELRMDSSVRTEIAPPRLIASIQAGFNLVANRAYLLAFPILLDLFIWLGPRYRVKALFSPFIEDWLNMTQTMAGEQAVSMVEVVRQFWQFQLERFNLFSALSTFPIGIPSLMAGLMPARTPWGMPSIIEAQSFGQFLSGWLLFGLLGLVLGCVYFSLLASEVRLFEERDSIRLLVWEVGQVFLLVMSLILLALVISVPLLGMAVILEMISLQFLQMFILVVMVALLWIVVPLAFTPHGIFVARRNFLTSALLSVRTWRWLFPGIALFLISLLLISQGLGYLWRIPPEDSWLMLAGILGNAVVSTALLGASFVYYRDALLWAETLRRATQVLK